MSGGPDSLALLALCQAVLPDRIAVATVDHGLRPESAAEAREVADLCRDIGVPSEILSVRVEPGNVQANARDARYAALSDWAQDRCAVVATAHHADDQAETVLMRLNRGAGLSGLAGVRARALLTRDIPLVRPLLGWRKNELVAVVERMGWTAANDPSNRDDRFDRAVLRKRLAGCDWLDIGGLAQSASHLAEVEDDVLQRCAIEIAANVVSQGERTTYRPHAGRYIRKRVLQMLLAERGRTVSLTQVANLVDRLERGEPANVASFLISPADGEWRLVPEPPRKA